jgi:hypothetical protein
MGHHVFRRMGDRLVVVADSKPPSAAEWQQFIDACVALDKEGAGGIGSASALIFTDGGGPDSGQRLALKKVLRGQAAPAAMVTDSLAVRTVVGLISFFNPQIKVFKSAEWRQAALLARFKEEELLEVLRVAVSLSHEVEGSQVLRTIGL